MWKINTNTKISNRDLDYLGSEKSQKQHFKYWKLLNIRKISNFVEGSKIATATSRS